MLGLISLLLQGLIILVVFATFLVVDRLRRPPRKTYAGAVARALPGDPGELPAPRKFRRFEFDVPRQAASGRAGTPVRLPAWEIEGELVNDPAAPVIVCTPGWGDSMLGVLPRLDGLIGIASRIVGWDPEGLGESPAASRCNLGTERDVHGLCELTRTLAPTTEASAPLILYGWSMGAGVSIAAALRLARVGGAPVAVIAEAPYRLPETPVVNYLKLVRMPWRLTLPLARVWLGWRLKTRGWKTFDRAKLARDLPCPLLVIHGTQDEICPHEDGRSIAAAAPRSLFISIEGAGHNNLWTEEPHRTQCIRAVVDFVRAALASTRR